MIVPVNDTILVKHSCFLRLFAHSIRDYWSVFKVILRKQQWQTVFLKRFCIMWSLENLFVWKNIHRVFYQRKDCISDNLWWCKNILQICASLVFVNRPTPPTAERAWCFIYDSKCCTSLTGRSHLKNSMLWLSCKTLR